MNRNPTNILLIFLVLGFLGCQKDQEVNMDVNVAIMQEMETQRITSVAACIVKDQEIVWEGSFGYKDAALSKPTDRRTLYTIMSIGKVILSTAVMQLWEQGSINLDADINQYLPFEVRNPNYPDRKITAHMLLNHSSSLAWPEDPDGIPDFHHFYTSEEPPLIRSWLPDYILPTGSQYRITVWKNFPPGKQFLYSNIGASLLALIVEEISGMDYRDYCRENIFMPLDMQHTAFRLSKLNSENLVTPYYDSGFPMPYYTCRHYPAGFISTDIEDFSHFMIAVSNKGIYQNKRVLKESTFDKMVKLVDATSGTANLWVHCLGDCIGHLGGGTGFSTWAEWHLEAGTGFFIFSNRVNQSIAPKGRIYELVKYQAYQY